MAFERLNRSTQLPALRNAYDPFLFRVVDSSRSEFIKHLSDPYRIDANRIFGRQQSGSLEHAYDIDEFGNVIAHMVNNCEIAGRLQIAKLRRDLLTAIQDRRVNPRLRVMKPFPRFAFASYCGKS